MTTEKCARCILLRLSARCLHIKCICLQKVCIKSAFSPTGGFPQTKPPLVCRQRAEHVQTMHTLCRLSADFVVKSVHLAHFAHLARVCQVCKNQKCAGLHTLHTLSLVCKVCSKCQPLSGKPSKYLVAIQHLCTSRAYLFRPGRFVHWQLRFRPLAVTHVYDNLHNICIISAQVCTSVHTVCIIHLMHTW